MTSRLLLQLEGALHKNYLNKRRNLRVTLCELLSPLVLVLLLSYGYFQSDILAFDAKTFAQLDFDLPSDISAFLPTGGISAQGNDGSGDDAAAVDDDTAAAAEGTELDSLFDIQKFLSKLLRGPLPAPSFDQFVLLSSAVSSGVDQELYNDLIGETNYGRAFGNLVTLGTLHLSPAGPAADAFVKFATETTLTFGSTANNGSSFFNHQVHEDEAAALAWIDENAALDRAWVLINLESISEGNVDYTLRFNYSTVSSGAPT
jgi:hypothetical protein